MSKIVGALALALMVAAGAGPVMAQAQQKAADTENTLILELKTGKVTIQLRPDLAPRHVERVKRLAREKFYDGLTFHRVIAGFMAQTGDPKGDGTGGSKYGNVPAEFTKTPFVRGTVGAARAQNPDSANSQFFIMFDRNAGLDNQYTVWGQVTAGMEHVDQIKKGDQRANGKVTDPDRIVKVYVLADAAKAAAPAAPPPTAPPPAQQQKK